MVKKTKKEMKQFDIEEIIARVDNFFDAQKLETESKYFIHKVMMERCWEDHIRPDKQDSLSDFTSDEDYDDIDESDVSLDVDDVLKDTESSDTELLDSDFDDDEDEGEDVGEELLASLEENPEVLGVDDLMSDIEEENVVSKAKEEKKIAKKNKGDD